MDRIEEILGFWLGSNLDDEQALGRHFRLWFRGGPEVDREIGERFGADLERARRGELAAWAETPRGRLALIILLDQFSRNIYRGTAQAFAADEAAQELAVEGLNLGMDATLGAHERMFFVLPLGHAENLELQERAVRYCEEWTRLLPPSQRQLGESAKAHAAMHRDVIARFGRFPTRNDVLGRVSTPEEAAHVEQAKAAGRPV